MGRADRWAMLTIALGLPALLSACAGVPRDPSMPINDPNESFNRNVLKLNQVVIDPAANVVKAVTPGPVLNRLSDLDANLKEPRIFANDILQGRFNAAGITLGRFLFNSTFGLGGLFDVASSGGLKQQTGDFGQTLFVWGVPDGTFVEAPYFGPSTQRDSIGGLVDIGARSRRLDGWKRIGLGLDGRRCGPRRCGASRAVEGGRERLDRLLQLLAVELLSKPPGGSARGAWPAPRDGIAGDGLAGSLTRGGGAA